MVIKLEFHGIIEVEELNLSVMISIKENKLVNRNLLLKEQFSVAPYQNTVNFILTKWPILWRTFAENWEYNDSQMGFSSKIWTR